jgi:hypothetical protein
MIFSTFASEPNRLASVGIGSMAVVFVVFVPGAVVSVAAAVSP